MRFNRVVGSQDGVGIGECVLKPRKGWMEPIDSSRFSTEHPFIIGRFCYSFFENWKFDAGDGWGSLPCWTDTACPANFMNIARY